MKKLLTSVFASLFIFSNAYSLDMSSVSVGISASSAVFAATGTETKVEDQNSGAGTLDKTSEYGAFQSDFVSVFVELDASDVVSFGLDYVPEAIETPQNINIQGSENTETENKVQADFENLMTLYAKINVPLGGLYMKVGYSQVDVKTNESMASTRGYKDVSTDGPMAGIGYEISGDTGVSVRAEITGYQFDDVSADNGATTRKNTIEVSDMIGARGTISLVKSF